MSWGTDFENIVDSNVIVLSDFMKILADESLDISVLIF